MALEEGSYLKSVRTQYEDYPYPPRNPEDERLKLFSTKTAGLDCINHYCFKGHKDFNKGIRVLIPGGGTGDCTIYLAEQLRHTDSEIVYVDMSTGSMELAKKRAEIRKLSNITWINDSILNIPKLNLGKFDFITCTGVLHHLENPQLGLNALRDVLDEDGSMFLMLYGTYGRTAIYQMQELFRRINSDTDPIDEQIQTTKKVLAQLPKTNWFNFNKNMIQDLETDIGIYDLLLHSQDRAYTIPQLYDYVEASGLKINTLVNYDTPLGNLVFEPSTFIQDSKILNKIKHYPVPEQAAISEILFGQLLKQNCYLSFKDKEPASPENSTLVPVFSLSFEERKQTSAAMYQGTAPEIQISDMIKIPRTPHISSFFKQIDGKSSIDQIITNIAQNSDITQDKEQILKEFLIWYEPMMKTGNMYLKEGVVGAYQSHKKIQQSLI